MTNYQLSLLGNGNKYPKPEIYRPNSKQDTYAVQKFLQSVFEYYHRKS